MTIRWRGSKFWFVLPWLIGLGCFSLYPFLASLYYSFTDYCVLQPPHWTGLNNFSAVAQDPIFWKVLKNTLLYAALAIPSGLLVSLSLAVLMNACRRGQVLYSVIFYLPQLVPAVVSAILWMFIFNVDFGLLNSALQPFCALLRAVGFGKVEPPGWLADPHWALPALVLMGLWSTGQTAFIYLAKLQDVPRELYEAAEIDGASVWQKLRHVTLPMISPIIFFNIIMSIIGTFQIFTEPYMMTEGGPARATYFLPHYIWDNAFRYLRMGYASALAWILFVIILGLTMLAFRLAKDRVYYAGK